MSTLEIGPLRIKTSRTAVHSEGKPIGQLESMACLQNVYFVSGPDGIALDVVHRFFSNGQSEVITIDTGDSPHPYIRLGRGLRLGIQREEDFAWCEIRIAKLKTLDYSTMVQTDISTIDGLTENSILEILKHQGALQVGKRSSVLSDTSRRRNEIVVTFPLENSIVPVLVYVITRPLALLRRNGA